MTEVSWFDSGQGQEIILYSKASRHWVPPSLLMNGYRGAHSLGCNGRNVMETSACLVLRLRMSEVKLRFAICLHVMHRLSCTFTVIQSRRRPIGLLFLRNLIPSFFVEWAGIDQSL
jgi:hypothetical protein